MIQDPNPPVQKDVTAKSGPDLEIVVINLKQAEERRRLIEEQFATLDHPWRFFEAHTELANPAMRYDPERILRTYGREMTPSQIALCSSHYSVISAFADAGTSDYLLVFEDDVIFDTAFPLDTLIQLCEEEDIHYIRLFGMYHAAARQLSFFYDRAIIRYRSSPAGAQAYILSKKGAARVAETCRNIETAWDLSLDEFWKTRLPIYAVFPFPAMERFSPTSVPMNDIEPLALKDRLPLLAHRASKKLRKILANRQLASADNTLRARNRGFRQIHQATMRNE